MAPLAAAGIAAEMLLFSGVHLASGDAHYGPMIYWLVVAAVCAFIAYGRFVLRPLNATRRLDENDMKLGPTDHVARRTEELRNG